MLFHCIALVFGRLECQKLSTQSAAKAGGTIRAAPAAPLFGPVPFGTCFGLECYNHSGFQSDLSISPWDSITAMQLQLGGTKVTAYGKASWICIVLVDCLPMENMWNIYCT